MLMHPAIRVGMSGLELSEALRLVNRLKNTNLSKFRTMCMMHLSFLLDLPGRSLEDFLSQDYTLGASTSSSGSNSSLNELKAKKHFFKRKTSKGDRNPEVGLFGAPLTRETIEQILPLIQFLSRTENLQQEGLFRKTGHLVRQKELKEKLNNGDDIIADLEEGTYSAHDCASLLKAYLAELPEPILLEKHYPAFCQVLDMVQDGLTDELTALKAAKQLQTVQLLLQLLPRDNLFLLEHLLRLLHQVAQSGDENRMTSEALGMLLTPCILVPRKMSGSELHSVAGNITKIVTYMIDNAEELLKVPDALVRDIANYWEEMEELNELTPASSSSSSWTPRSVTSVTSATSVGDEQDSSRTSRHRRRMNPDVVNTTVSFVDRAASQQAAALTDTQYELAQLYAHVSAMPESAKKRKLLKQFNKANGVGTPASVGSAAVPCKHKRSKSLGDSLKKVVTQTSNIFKKPGPLKAENKMVGRNHKRRGSGNCKQVLTLADTPAPSIESCSNPNMQHTPIIKRLSDDCSTPTPCSPVKRLFTTLPQPVLPSSPRVHIVDMKATEKRSNLGLRLPRKHLHDGVSSPSEPPAKQCSYSPTTAICHPWDDDKSNDENIPLHQRGCQRSSKAHSPVFVTPDRRFEKPTAFISPITRTLSNQPKALQDQMLTPGSRRPMSLVQP